MVTVVDCFAMGQWRGGHMSTSVPQNLWSPQQESIFFGVLAYNIKNGGQISQGLKAISCSGAFYKALVKMAKELAQLDSSSGRRAKWPASELPELRAASLS
jgi:hypothetical protein